MKCESSYLTFLSQKNWPNCKTSHDEFQPI